MRGFSLVEVLVSIVVVAVALLALVGVQAFSLRTRGATGEQHTASVVAASTISQCEQELGVSFSTSVARNRAPLPEHPGFELEVRESEERANLLKRLEVEVFWESQRGPQSYLLITRVVRK